MYYLLTAAAVFAVTAAVFKNIYGKKLTELKREISDRNQQADKQKQDTVCLLKDIYANANNVYIYLKLSADSDKRDDIIKNISVAERENECIIEKIKKFNS